MSSSQPANKMPDTTPQLPDDAPKPKKGGIIRRGQKHVYRKATNLEIEARIEYCASLLMEMKTKTEIHKAMKDKYKLCYLVIDTLYIKRAKEWLAKRAAISKDAARQIVVNGCLQVFRNGKDRTRLEALRLLSDIIGIQAPKRTELTGAGGGPIAVHADEAEQTIRDLPKDEVLALLEQTRLQLVYKNNGGGKE